MTSVVRIILLIISCLNVLYKTDLGVCVLYSESIRHHTRFKQDIYQLASIVSTQTGALWWICSLLDDLENMACINL
jgi:hypothetical protein